MKPLLVVSICIVLLISACASAHAEGWQLDLKLDQYDKYLDSSQRLTKTLGDLTLLMQARQLDVGKGETNSLNFRLSTKLFGIEYITNEEVPQSMLSFAIATPRQEKPTIVKTPGNEVFHAFAQTEWQAGFAKFDFFTKDGVTQFSFNARAEF